LQVFVGAFELILCLWLQLSFFFEKSELFVKCALFRVGELCKFFFAKSLKEIWLGRLLST